jgi:hypothetical protein
MPTTRFQEGQEFRRGDVRLELRVPFDDAIGTRVRVYRNLNNGKISVMYKQKVVAHGSTVCLADVKMIVSEASRQRVLKEKTRNVHAFMEGVLVEECHGTEAVTYNPYAGPTFTLKSTGKPILTARFASLRILPEGALRVLITP